MENKIRSFKKGMLHVEIFNTEEGIAKAAASFVANGLNEAINKKGEASLIIGTGASQFLFINSLIKEKIDWGKINLFHLDEYKDMPASHPASFRKFLKERLADKVNPKHVFYVEGDATDIEAEIERYEMLLKKFPVDVACIGIGENGHIAFNDPPVADFNDPKLVKLVKLDDACRNQQLGEGWFPTFDDVPKEALTLTVTAIMNCKTISCAVPGKRKSDAVFNALNDEISTKCPASILREHPNAMLFLDALSASKII